MGWKNKNMETEEMLRVLTAVFEANKTKYMNPAAAHAFRLLTNWTNVDLQYMNISCWFVQ